MRPYVVRLDNIAVTGAITLIAVTAPSTGNIVLLRAWCSQSSSTTATQLPVEILRKTAAVTGTSFTPLALNENDSAASSTCLINATAEGTDGNVLIREAWEYLNGWLWVPTPEERIVVKASGIIAMKLPVAPGASVTLQAGFVFGEV
jgi:hypothetical protein